MKRTGLTAVAAMLVLTGCGTITRGNKENVVINTRPTGAKVTTSLGQSCPKSPCTFEVKRRQEFDAFATKPGYGSGQVHVGTKLTKDGMTKMAGNMLLPGGSAGLAVDVISGSARDHDPNPALIILKRGGGKAVRSQPPAKRKGAPVS